MKNATSEWIAKAEGDYNDVLRGIRARKNPNYDGVCFHVQQCLEKYLKGCLVEVGIEFPKTHDLPKLLDLILPLQPQWDRWRYSLNLITSFAVEFRYPGDFASEEDAREAFALCRTLRGHLRQHLKLKDDPKQGSRNKKSASRS